MISLNVNDKVCSVCKKRWEYFLLDNENYIKEYYKHIEEHLKHLVEERDWLRGVLEKKLIQIALHALEG